MEAESDPNGAAEEILKRYIDKGSLHYMAIQRSSKIMQLVPIDHLAMAAVYVDAFIAGCEFEACGGHREPEEKTDG